MVKHTDWLAQVSASIDIVLVNTTHPGNIGSAARAMKTMGLKQLVLVKPKFFPHAEATSLASGADDLLAQARVCETLHEAIAPAQIVYGTSARIRSIPLPGDDARIAAEKTLQAVKHGLRVAIVFGQERSGLSNDQISQCNRLLHIPTNPEYGSLNLSQTVQIVAYDLRMQTLMDDVETPLPEMPERESQIANVAQMDSFYQHLKKVMQDVEFMDEKQHKSLMQRWKRLFNRSEITEREIHILRGFLSAIEKKAQTK